MSEQSKENEKEVVETNNEIKNEVETNSTSSNETVAENKTDLTESNEVEEVADAQKGNENAASEIENVENIAVNKTESIKSDEVEKAAEAKLENKEAEKVVEKEVESTEKKEVQKVVVSKKENDDAVSEIENKMAEDAENEDEKEDDEKVDYADLSLEELILALQKIVENNPVQSIKSKVDAIKNAFNPKFGDLLAEKKAAFLAEGGESIDFKFSSPIKTDYNTVLSDYKKKRDAHYGELESRLGANLEKREAVIETLKTLIDEAEPQTMYGRFKELQERWKTIGPVPKQHYNDTWKIYHHHVERFYDLLNMSNDFKDADFRNNLDLKLSVVVKAEALAEEEDINAAFKQLQELHKLWKEGIGPVARENREEIWNRFSDATKKIHDKRHNHYKELRSQHQDIIDAKILAIEEMLNFDTAKNNAHNDWQNSIKEFEVLRKKYFDAGKLPFKKSEEVWQKFKNATKKFNKAKNNFYKQEKGDQQDNLNKKIALVELAESLKDSDDWETATNTFKKIQADWKKIGHVPRKFSNDIWKRFKVACNDYFDRLHQNKNKLNKDQEQVIENKKAFLEEVKNTEEITLSSAKDLIAKWAEIGVLPRSVRHLDSKFNKQIDALLKSNNIDKDKVEMLKFTSIVDAYQEENDSRKIESEMFFIRKKVDEAKKEVQQLENNLSFFSNSDSNNPLVKNVRDQTEKLKEDLDVWESKLNYVKKLDY